MSTCCRSHQNVNESTRTHTRALTTLLSHINTIPPTIETSALSKQSPRKLDKLSIKYHMVNKLVSSWILLSFLFTQVPRVVHGWHHILAHTEPEQHIMKIREVPPHVLSWCTLFNRVTHPISSHHRLSLSLTSIPLMSTFFQRCVHFSQSCVFCRSYYCTTIRLLCLSDCSQNLDQLTHMSLKVVYSFVRLRSDLGDVLTGGQ